MDIKPFLVEEWMNEFETGAKYNIAETCVDSISLDELLELCNEDRKKFIKSITEPRLTYGDIRGSEKLLSGIKSLYKSIKEENIVVTHGAAGANYHVFCSLLSKGDHVISIMPTYQQLYSIPEAIGADVDILKLEAEDGYLPNLEKLRKLIRKDTKLIAINNPNNPTGALIPNEILSEIAMIAKESGAYLLCDEVYRNLTQCDQDCYSIADLYEKGISVSSMSKVYSLAGIRLGWIATRSNDALSAFFHHRDYNLISCGIFDDKVASLALANSEKILKRNKNIVRTNLKILDDWIKAHEHFSYIKPKAGTTALVHYDYDIPSYEFCRRLYDNTGSFLTPGICFGIEHSFRIGYASERDDLIGGLKALEEFSSSL